MSVENGKVCCNCRYNKRYHDGSGVVYCECEVSGKWLGGVQVMTGWCRHWAKEGEDVKILTNAEWIDLLSEQFDISRTSAKEMLHVMMSVKKEDNFKKRFSGRK